MFDLWEYKVKVCVKPEIIPPLLSFGNSNSKPEPLGMNDLEEYSLINCSSLSTTSTKYEPVSMPTVNISSPVPNWLKVAPDDS